VRDENERGGGAATALLGCHEIKNQQKSTIKFLITGPQQT
jgi:hypothetical protein